MIEAFSIDWSDETGLNTPHTPFHVIVTEIVIDA
jgi:hypothetical protein